MDNEWEKLVKSANAARDDHFRNLQALAKKYAQVCRAKTDLEYMQVELVGMLGPKAKQVWDMWQEQGLCRIHVSWVSHLQGEERAEAHMEIDQAPKTVIGSVDGNLQKRPYCDTFSAFDAIADEVRTGGLND